MQSHTRSYQASSATGMRWAGASAHARQLKRRACPAAIARGFHDWSCKNQGSEQGDDSQLLSSSRTTTTTTTTRSRAWRSSLSTIAASTVQPQVYDSGCDGSGEFFMCDANAEFDPSTASCVYNATKRTGAQPTTVPRILRRIYARVASGCSLAPHHTRTLRIISATMHILC